MFYTKNRGLDSRSVVFNLIALNVIVYLIALFGGSHLASKLGLYYVFNPDFAPYQLITHMFMHDLHSPAHIFSNMFALYMFGTVLEKVWGGERFLIFYLITGLGAMLLHMMVQALIVFKGTGTIDPLPMMIPQYSEAFFAYFVPTVGASGAIFGILAGFGLLFPNTELMLLLFPIPIKAKYFVSFYILWELYRGFAMERGDNVAHFAHLGGALFGYIMIKIWSKNQRHFY